MTEKILITGRAGAGKTRNILGRAAELIRQRREGECLLLLPTQSQVDHLKGLLLSGGQPAFRDIFAHTFFTFCRMLFRGLPESLLSEEGRDYLVGDLLEAGRFPAFEKVREFTGFRRVLGEAFREIKDNGVTPADYSRRILPPLGGERGAAPRHRDLGKAYAVYQQALRDRRRLDKEDLALAALARLESEPGLLADRTLLLVDGFHDFTPVQFLILEKLAGRISRSVFTLSFDGERPGRAPFQVSALTREALLGLGFREKGLGGNRRTEDPTLRKIEEALFAPAGEPVEAGSSLQFVEASRREGEVEGIARAILRLAREEGVPWRDIAVLFHDLSGVMDLVEGTFQRFGIPARFYQPRPLDTQPAVRFLMDLGALLAGGAEPGRLIRILRSGYVLGLSLSEVDRLEAHLMETAAPSDGGEWQALALKLDLPGVKRVLKILGEGKARLAREKGAAPFPDLWREAFQSLALSKGTDGEAPLGESGPRGPHECAALQSFWRVLEEAAARREEPGRKASPGLLLADMEEEIGEATFRVRDRRREVVNVIGAREARQWEVPCLFVAGVLEREFPPLPVEDLLFNDEDRRRLNAAGLRFPDRAWRQEEERFLFYTAVTRARDRLVLSYPASDERGNPTLPSFFLGELRRIFTAESLAGRTTRRPAAAVLPAPEEMTGPEDVDRAVLMGLETRFPAGRPPGEVARAAALYNLRRGVPEFRERLGALLGERLPRLADPDNLRELAGAEVAFSNSALTSFHQCPYLHFVEKWLRLEPFPEREIDSLDLGNAIHAALKDYFESKGTADPLALLDGHFMKVAAARRRTFRQRSDFWRLRRALGSFLPGEMERNRKLGLSPELLEISFGTKGSEFPPLSMSVQGRKELLSGKIDRVDALPGRKAAVVVDYKYSAGETVKKQLRQGTGQEIGNFQIALYLMALGEVLGKEPAGAELVALKKRVERRGIGRREILEKANLSGPLGDDWDLVGEEEFRAFLDRAREAMAGLVKRIRAGEIGTEPADPAACGPGQCDAADICRYDRWLEKEEREE